MALRTWQEEQDLYKDVAAIVVDCDELNDQAQADRVIASLKRELGSAFHFNRLGDAIRTERNRRGPYILATQGGSVIAVVEHKDIEG